MVDKEEKEKLTEALKEYFGEDVGDVDYTITESNICYGEDLREPERRITIITKPHKPTFKEKRKELVDQLDKDLKEIDDGFGAQVQSSDGEISIHDGHAKIAQLYWDWVLNEFRMYVFPIETTVTVTVATVVKMMDAVSAFTQELERFGERCEDETV